jgi:hypothetical protein
MISEAIKRLTNAMRANNGLPPRYPAPVAAEPAPDIVDADEGNDGLELADADEALERLQEAVEAVNGEIGQPGDDDEAADDNNVAGRKRDDAGRFAKGDAMSSLGVLALPARTIYIAHLKDSAAEEKRAKAVSDMARFMLACHSRARGDAA